LFFYVDEEEAEVAHADESIIEAEEAKEEEELAVPITGTEGEDGEETSEAKEPEGKRIKIESEEDLDVDAGDDIPIEVSSF